MNSFDFRFRTSAIAKHSDKNEAADLINRILDVAIQFDQIDITHFKESVANNREDIIKKIPKNVDPDIVYSGAEIDEILPERDGSKNTFKPQYTWKVPYKLISEVYTCLSILPDKTIVCHKKGDKRLLFIPLAPKELIIE